jgi:hypothetical protein
MATKKHESMAKQEVNSPLIVTTGIISVLLLVVSAIGLEAWFRYEEATEVQDKWATNQNTWLADIRKDELNKLNGGKMPIEKAMQVVAQNQGKTR